MSPTTTDTTPSPVLHAAIPQRWRPYTARDVLVVARPPVDTGWFRTTLLIAQESIPATISLSTLFDATESALDDLGDDVEVFGQRYMLDGDVERVSRLVCFDVRGGVERIAQLQCFVAASAPDPNETVRPVAQFVGTCTFDELDRYGPAFVAVVDSIRFDTGAERLETPD